MIIGIAVKIPRKNELLNCARFFLSSILDAIKVKINAMTGGIRKEMIVAGPIIICVGL